MDAADMPTEPPSFTPGGADSLVPTFRLVQAADLFGTAREIGIVHGDALYRLRVTRAGKLILTK